MSPRLLIALDPELWIEIPSDASANWAQGKATGLVASWDGPPDEGAALARSLGEYVAIQTANPGVSRFVFAPGAARSGPMVAFGLSLADPSVDPVEMLARALPSAVIEPVACGELPAARAILSADIPVDDFNSGKSEGSSGVSIVLTAVYALRFRHGDGTWWDAMATAVSADPDFFALALSPLESALATVGVEP